MYMVFLRIKPENRCNLNLFAPFQNGFQVMLHGTIRNDDFLAQHSVAMLKQCCNSSKQRRNNVATLCCAKNRRCVSSHVTSPLNQRVRALFRGSLTFFKAIVRLVCVAKVVVVVEDIFSLKDFIYMQHIYSIFKFYIITFQITNLKLELETCV